MRLKIFREDPLIIFRRKSQIKENIQFYSETDNDWQQMMIDQPLFQEFGKQLQPIELDMSFSEPNKSDVVNAKIIYEALSFLSDSQASEERLWAALCHDMFWDYMQYRWPLSLTKRSEVNYVLAHYFFSEPSRGRYFNGISRLWWFARSTYDRTRENPYEVLEYFGGDLSGKLYPLLAGHNYSSNPIIMRQFMDGLFEYEKSLGEQVGRKQFSYLTKRLDLYSGGVQPDLLAEQGLLKDIVIEILHEFESR